VSSPPANAEEFIIKTLRTLYGRRPVSFVVCPRPGWVRLLLLVLPEALVELLAGWGLSYFLILLTTLSLLILYYLGFVDGSTFLPTRVSVVATGVRSTLSSVTFGDVIYTALILGSLGLTTSLYLFPNW
jgi:hypothetical protein